MCGRKLTRAFLRKDRSETRMPAVALPILLAIDWILKTSTVQTGNGIQWTLWTRLDDLDFADDLALLFHTRPQVQEKTSTVADNLARLGLKVHRDKSKVLKKNSSASTTPITLDGDALEDLTSFTFLGSIVDKQGALTPM